MSDKKIYPSHLYHYTSIEKLALILKNQTIRLNPLDTMDDLQEAKTADVENIGKFVFVSSWTSEEDESIPMWNMYTELSSGVRIKLKTNPFLRHGTYGKDIVSKMSYQTDEETKKQKLDTFLDLSELMKSNVTSPQAFGGDILHQVIYTRDRKFLEPQIATVTDENVNLNLGILGKHKNEGWSFQKEWRYIMNFVTMRFDTSIENMMKEFTLTANKMLKGKEPPPFRYYDLKIEPLAFSEMEITVSPQLSPGNRVLLETLIEKYNPTAIIIESQYTGLI